MKKLIMSLMVMVMACMSTAHAQEEELAGNEFVSNSILEGMVMFTTNKVLVKAPGDDEFMEPGFVPLPCGELQFISRTHGILMEETMDGPSEIDINLTVFENTVYTPQEICEVLMEN